MRWVEVCLHCGKARANASRGLCRVCFNDHTTRSKYEPLSHGSPVGQPMQQGDRMISLGLPTTYLPGSEGKIQVLAERARLGLSLWHPKDAILDYSGGDVTIRYGKMIGVSGA